MSEEDNVLKFTNQLEYSEYVEDQMSALNNLYKIVNQNTLIVGIYSLTTIIKSIKRTNEYKMQSKMIAKILKTYQKNEFIEIIIKNKECVLILFEYKKYLSEILLIIAKSKGTEIFDILQAENKLDTIFTDFDLSISYVKYLITDYNKETFCHEGTFETILEIINDKNHKFCIETVCKLLQDSLFNQNYFIELKWLDVFGVYKINDILIQLLDKRNKNYSRNQKIYCKKKFIDVKDYNLIERLIYNNPENFVYIENCGFDVYNVCNSNCDIKQIINLVEEVLKYKNLDYKKINETNSNYYYILSLIYMHQKKDIVCVLNETDILNEHLYVLFRLNEYKNIEQLGYIIFIVLISDEIVLPQNFLNIVKEYVIDKRNYNVAQNFLFYMIYDKYKNNYVFEYTDEFYVAKLKDLRCYLSSSDTFLTSKIKEHFISKITDKTFFMTCRNYSEEYKAAKDQYNELIKNKLVINCGKEKIIETKAENIIQQQNNNMNNNTRIINNTEPETITQSKKITYKERLAGFINKVKYENNKKNSDNDNDLFEL